LKSGPVAPFFSILLLNWNGKHLLQECVDSVLEQSDRDFEILVVDNGSTDGSAEFIRTEYGDRVRLVPLEKNLGFSGGNNVGIGRARGRWVVFLNNDTRVDSRWLEELHSAAGRYPEVPVFACKVLNYFRRDEIDTVGHLLYPDGISRGRGRLEKDTGQYDREEEVIFPSGCAAAYRKDLLDAIGGFDESFFAYGDDTELGLRARIYGARCMLVPKAVVFHKYSSTVGTYSEFKVYQVERNRFWVMVKYFPLRWILVSPFYTGYRMAHHFLAALRRKGASGKFAEDQSSLRLIRIVFRAYRDALAKLPAVLAERRRLRRFRNVTSGQFAEWIKRFRLTAAEVAWKD
jgi:GT2 family glycosyltransferase